MNPASCLPPQADIEAKVPIPTDEPVLLEEQENPRCWSAGKKCNGILVLMTATIAFCSSIYTAAIPSISHAYGCSSTVATLGITTFLLGFASGPLLFAPLSEVWGRNTIFRLVLGLFVLFQIGCALAPNVASMIVFRFFSGFFGSPTVTNSGGSITDIWPQDNRSVPLALFSAASFLGPVIAPTVGGFICQYTSWRWNFWVVLILSGVCYVAMTVFLPETYPPKLLMDKRRSMPGYSPANQPPIKEMLYTTLTRPWLMLFTEPILFLLSLYMALVYGILYLDFTAYPVVYRETRGWSASIAGLSFLGICVGMAIATLISPYVNQIHGIYVRRLGGPQPEARLPHLIVISWLIPVSLFWFAWTASPPTHWISGIVAGVPFGFGLILLFLGITSYLTDCYGSFGASALAANAVLRSLFGAVFPLFSTSLYHSLGTSWATSLLGFVALAMAPLPWVFYRFGPRIRSRSKYHLKTREAQEEVHRGHWTGLPHPGDSFRSSTIRSLSLQKEMFRLSREFFALPLDEKMKLDKSRMTTTAATESGPAPEPPASPLQEVRTQTEPLARVAGPALPRHLLGLPQPSSRPHRESPSSHWVSLGYDESYFDEFYTEPMAFYKLLHYPPQPPDTDPLQRGIGAHRDFGVITLLLQGDVPGLEVWHEETQSYYPAPPIEGAYVVNLGNLFQQWTNDEYLSNVHWVINRSDVDRYSIPFNYNGNPDFVIRCIESCRAMPEDEKYAPISADDYVRQKYKDVYGRVGIYSVAERAKAQAVA
ncbi:hypothetical protein CNMCM6069_001716 [Aspergillus lentulus]|nr:hypothetical protein CNMCM6069_001716 [Aspergillus lentulus]KAF4178287.1 hypothetical protein CNMCM8060_004590 [Aspergillus lentulus]KAF4198506.1 hypothetical protein CNMCM8694_009219 [Aspergillus lentulus]